MSESPLNPDLYTLLCRRFGESNVEIAAPGQAINWQLVQSAGSLASAPPKRRVVVQGEEYRVPCPFCNDYKRRLYINHMWGVYDPDSNSRNTWLAQCFNEQCLSSTARQQQLLSMVWNVRQGQVRVRQGKPATGLVLSEVELPGAVIRLDELADEQPRHPALLYLESRQFNPRLLSQLYDVSYCPQSRYGLATDRIIIPIYERGKLYGWQARHIGDTRNGVSLKQLGIPKYWTMPKTPKQLLGYNLEMAVRHQTIVMVEGPMDVWGIGPQGFGLLGKTVNHLLVQKLDKWRKLYWGDEAVVVVLLDPDPDEKARQSGKPHHIAEAADRLKRGLGLGMRSRVLPVYLPAGTDPGSLDRNLMRRIIRKAASEQGVKVYFDAQHRLPPVPAEQLLFDPLEEVAHE